MSAPRCEQGDESSLGRLCDFGVKVGGGEHGGVLGVLEASVGGRGEHSERGERNELHGDVEEKSGLESDRLSTWATTCLSLCALLHWSSRLVSTLTVSRAELVPRL